MPLDSKPFLKEAHLSTKTILLVEDDPYISSFLVEAITQETPFSLHREREVETHSSLRMRCIQCEQKKRIILAHRRQTPGPAER
jgi:hypothetical protein